MIHVVTPFSRPENRERVGFNVLSNADSWHPLHHDPWEDHDLIDFPFGFAVPMLTPYPQEWSWPCYWKMNRFIESGLVQTDYYCVLCDDDLYEPGWIDKVRPLCDGKNEAVVCSMLGNPHDRVTRMVAAPENMRESSIGFEQVIVRGDVMSRFRYNNHAHADGQFVEAMVRAGVQFAYCPEAHVLFNALR